MSRASKMFKHTLDTAAALECRVSAQDSLGDRTAEGGAISNDTHLGRTEGHVLDLVLITLCSCQLVLAGLQRSGLVDRGRTRHLSCGFTQTNAHSTPGQLDPAGGAWYVRVNTPALRGPGCVEVDQETLHTIVGDSIPAVRGEAQPSCSNVAVFECHTSLSSL